MKNLSYFSPLQANQLRSKIFFLHIPKCGGTSMDESIRRSFGFFGKKKIFQLNAHASLKGAAIANRNLMDFREDILLYSMSNHNYQYIAGHFRYSDKVYEEFGDNWKFITTLRHPVKKWISQYFFNRSKKDNHFSINSDLESFVDSEAGRKLGSDYVQKLTDKNLGLDPTSKEAISIAAANLSNFSLVGFLEDLNGFTQDYKKTFGVQLKIKNKNSNPVSKSQQKSQISSQLRNKIEEVCQPDMELYQLALKQWNPKLLDVF